ncbi:MAG TPA: PIN domain-containing protein [Solirubrobacteraceae bacterium]
MPGESDDSGPWGEMPLVVDNSAWSRADRPEIREDWNRALHADRLRISPVARLEILYSARSGTIFDDLTQELSTLRAAPLTPSIIRAAEDAMRTLAHRSAGAQRLPLVDYLLAATAQHTSCAVLHYDRDFDTLAQIMDFDSIWLAPAGSIP